LNSQKNKLKDKVQDNSEANGDNISEKYDEIIDITFK